MGLPRSVATCCFNCWYSGIAVSGLLAGYNWAGSPFL
jgi:hypothetical protein